MSHAAAPLPSHGWRRNLAICTFLVGMAVFLLSAVTIFLTVKETNLLFRVGNALYSGAKLLLLNFDPKENEPMAWPLEIARLLSPFVFGSTAFLTLYEIFRNRIRLGFLGLLGNHVVVCGLNEQNLHVVRELRRRRDQVVVVDKNPVNELLSSVEEMGAISLIGDAATANTLRKAHVNRAKYLIAREADDGKNIEIGLRAIPIRIQYGRPGAPPLDCFLHLAHLELRHLFRQHQVLAKKNQQVVPHLFTTYENSARILLSNYPLEPFKFGPHDPRTVHLVIIGFGQMGESVALQAAKISHFANGKKLKLTVIDRKAQMRKDRLSFYYPKFTEVCEAEFMDAEGDDPTQIAKMVHWSQGPEMVTTFVVCFDDDQHSLTFALSLRQKIDRRAPIRVRMASSAGLATLIDRGTNAPEILSDLTPFGGEDEANQVELIIGEKLDLQAKAIHEDFVSRRKREGDLPEKNPALANWNQLGADFVESNRQQADHLMVKLRAIGCYSSPPKKNETPYPFSEASEIEVLAKMEHSRWIAERKLAGWKRGAVKDEKEKNSPYLVEWSELDEKVKDYDREAVLNIPRLFEPINEKIYR
jgi:voltage-gated potassium channel Kch